MNTCRWPLRTSTHSAVLITSRGSAPRGFAAPSRVRERRRARAARRAARTDRPASSVLDVLRQDVRQRCQRQPQAERRIAGERVQALALQRPRARLPTPMRIVALGVAAPQRQHEPGRSIEPLQQQAREPRALVRLREIGQQRIDVGGQRRFGLQGASAHPRTR